MTPTTEVTPASRDARNKDASNRSDANSRRVVTCGDAINKNASNSSNGSKSRVVTNTRYDTNNGEDN